MSVQPVILWTDSLVFLLLFMLCGFCFWVRRKQHVRIAMQELLAKPLAMFAVVVMAVFLLIAVLDSLHFKAAQINDNWPYTTSVVSVFDALIAPLGQELEKTYSAPLATTLFVKQSDINEFGALVREYPELQHVSDAALRDGAGDVLWQPVLGLTLVFAILLWLVVHFVPTQRAIQWRTLLATLLIILWMVSLLSVMAHHVHVFGTDKVGQDVLYLTLKSIRTGLVIGTLTTLVMLPFAIFLGIAAGYFGGLIDDVIQYAYITLSSIPGVLLIAASVLSLQIFISNHAEWFTTLEHRADARLLTLCAILGVTSWTGLCRLLRAETLKLREIDFIQAAYALGAGHTQIIFRHILPNVMHIVIITVVLDFSTLVLAEAVLSYVGAGVDPSSISWGNMINSARLELAREPIVWWPLLAAFIFMFTVVLAANLLSDALRDSFDPRLRQL